MFNISFETNGDKTCTTMICCIETNLPCEKSELAVEWECDRQYEAQLLTRHCQEQLSQSIERIAESAYTLGYSDGRAHKRRRDCFEHRLNATEPMAW